MALNEAKRRCVMRTKRGETCRNWAVRGSEPPLCSPHGGRNVGAGAPVGNENGVKHGFYQRRFSAVEMAEADEATLADELRLLRVALRRAALFLERADLTVVEYTAVLTLMCRAVRTVAYLEPRVRAQERAMEWEVVLDEVASGFGFERADG